MFTTKLTRAAPRATAALSSQTSSTTPQQATRCLATRPPHQRRQSSSKANTPPDSTSSSGKPAPAAKAAKADSPVPAERKKSGYRVAAGKGKVKAREREREGVDQFAGLPSVPPLQGMETAEVQKGMSYHALRCVALRRTLESAMANDGMETDLSMSSFFSLHRPISLTTPFPPTVTEQTFSSIFSARNQQDPWHNGNSAERRPEDIIITLSNTIEMLEGHQNQAENEGVRWEVLNESSSNADGGVKHLDGAPQPRMKSLDELVANFRPFRAPPPPEPFDEKYLRPASTGPAQKQKKATSATKKARKPKQKVYITEIRVTESTHSDGRKTYAASSSPIRRLEEQQEQSTSRQLFLERMRRRSERGVREEIGRIRQPMPVKVYFGMGWRRREEWRLISVKRQRKLKMKKHKHKKLMKRTRNLRRRLGRT